MCVGVESQRGGSVSTTVRNAAAEASPLALCQVVEMPLLQPERFVALGIDPPKVLRVVANRLQYMLLVTFVSRQVQEEI